MYSLKTKLLFTGIVISILPLMIYQYLTFSQTSKTLHVEYAKELEQKTELTTLLINQFVYNAISELKVLSASTQELIKIGDLNSVKSQFENFGRIRLDIESIKLIDKSGRILISSSHHDIEYKNQINLKSMIRKYLKTDMSDVFVSDVMHHDKPEIFILSKIDSQEKYFILMEMSFRNIELLLLNFEDDILGDKPVNIIDEDARIVFTTSQILRSNSLMGYVENIEYGESVFDRVYKNIDYENDSVMTTYDDVASFGVNKALNWRLLTAIPISVIDEKVYETLKLNTNSGFIIVVITFIILMLIAKNLSKSIEIVLNLAKRLSSGDYSARLNENSSTKELNELNIILNEMASRIESHNTEIQDEKMKFEAIYNSSKDAIAILDMDSNFLTVNPAFMEMTGFSREELLKTSDKAMTLQKDIDATNRAIDEVSNDGFLKNFEKSYITKEGKEIIVNMSMSKLYNPDRVLIGVRDITKRKEMEHSIYLAKERAEEATRSKSQFLANISHELRTPLNAIIGFSQILKSKKEIPLESREFINKIFVSGENLLKLINSVLDFSKIEAGQLKLEKVRFNMHKLMQSVIYQIESKAKENNLELSIEYHDEVPKSFFGDSLRIFQIVTNLVNNAVKFTNDGEVSMHILKIKQNRYRFEVRDSGIGLTPEQQAKLFQSFSQADETITRKYGGTGLGLTISKELIEMMNGHIWVESEKNVGSSFIFEIDLEEIEDFEEEAQDDESFESKLGKLQKNSKILLVEDNKTNQLVVMGLLDESGIEIDIANNGKEAVDMFEENKYALILMDLQMPVMSGYVAAQTIREMDKDIPIIALSANVMKEDIEKSYQAGMNGHLNKPIEVEKLYATLNKYIGD